MGTFLSHPPKKLVAGRSGTYRHWFGGSPAHLGVIPSGREHPVHLLYDLDLRDPALGLAEFFPGLSRLPLYNALQYNCCDMVYRVVADNAIEIVVMTNPEKPDWYADHPFDNYPKSFEKHPVTVEPVESEGVKLLEQLLVDDADYYTSAESNPIRQQLETFEYPFSRVGGKQFMWQGIPDWNCHGHGRRYAKNSSDGKEVFAVVWERPVPAFICGVESRSIKMSAVFRSSFQDARDAALCIRATGVIDRKTNHVRAH